jgi:hypothetical protein
MKGSDKIFSSLVLIVFLLGCTGQGGDGTVSEAVGDGVAITAFSADYSELYEGDNTLITLSIENKGERKASEITAQLFNYGDLDIDLDEANQEIINDLEVNDVDQINFRVTAPNSVQMVNSYSPSARLCFTYSTVSRQDFLLTQGDWRGDVPVLDSGVTEGPFSSAIDVQSPIRGKRVSKAIKVSVDKGDTGFVANGTDVTLVNGIAKYGVKGHIASMELRIPKMLYCPEYTTSQNVDADSACIEPEGWDENNLYYETGDFRCIECADDANYWCCNVTNKEDLRLIGGDTGLFRMYVNSNIDDEGTLEYTGRVRAEFLYKFCQDTTDAFPLYVSVSPQR